MTRDEHWRQRLLELKQDTKLSQAALSSKTGIDPTYISRLLYPPEKAGRKRLGMDTMRAFREAFNLSADWFDLPLGAALPSASAYGGGPLIAAQSTATTQPVVTHIKWPFRQLSYKRLTELIRSLGPESNEAVKDMDTMLDLLATKWERVAAEKKRRRA